MYRTKQTMNLPNFFTTAVHILRLRVIVALRPSPHSSKSIQSLSDKSANEFEILTLWNAFPNAKSPSQTDSDVQRLQIYEVVHVFVTRKWVKNGLQVLGNWYVSVIAKPEMVRVSCQFEST